MTLDPNEEVHFKLKIAELDPQHADASMRMALIQNTLMGVREQAIFGLQPNDGKTVLVDTLTMDVCSTPSEVEMRTQTIAQQWGVLQDSLHTGQKLQMSLPPQTRLAAKPSLYNAQRWMLLLKDFASLTQQHPEEQFLQSGLLHHKGMLAQFLYTEKRPDLFELRLDLGPIPPRIPASAVYKSMLMHNHAAGQASGIWWGIHPNQDRVIMIVEYPVFLVPGEPHTVRAQDLSKLLNDNVEQAQAFWRAVDMTVSHVQNPPPSAPSHHMT